MDAIKPDTRTDLSTKLPAELHLSIIEHIDNPIALASVNRIFRELIYDKDIDLSLFKYFSKALRIQLGGIVNTKRRFENIEAPWLLKLHKTMIVALLNFEYPKAKIFNKKSKIFHPSFYNIFLFQKFINSSLNNKVNIQQVFYYCNSKNNFLNCLKPILSSENSSEIISDDLCNVLEKALKNDDLDAFILIHSKLVSNSSEFDFNQILTWTSARKCPKISSYILKHSESNLSGNSLRHLLSRGFEHGSPEVIKVVLAHPKASSKFSESLGKILCQLISRAFSEEERKQLGFFPAQTLSLKHLSRALWWATEFHYPKIIEIILQDPQAKEIPFEELGKAYRNAHIRGHKALASSLAEFILNHPEAKKAFIKKISSDPQIISSFLSNREILNAGEEILFIGNLITLLQWGIEKDLSFIVENILNHPKAHMIPIKYLSNSLSQIINLSDIPYESIKALFTYLTKYRLKEMSIDLLSSAFHFASANKLNDILSNIKSRILEISDQDLQIGVELLSIYN